MYTQFFINVFLHQIKYFGLFIIIRVFHSMCNFPTTVDVAHLSNETKFVRAKIVFFQPWKRGCNSVYEHVLHYWLHEPLSKCHYQEENTTELPESLEQGSVDYSLVSFAQQVCFKYVRHYPLAVFLVFREDW